MPYRCAFLPYLPHPRTGYVYRWGSNNRPSHNKALPFNTGGKIPGFSRVNALFSISRLISEGE